MLHGPVFSEPFKLVLTIRFCTFNWKSLNLQFSHTVDLRLLVYKDLDMDRSKRWKKYGVITGIILLLAGAVDPLEGSVAILVGSGVLALVTNYYKDRYRKTFLWGFILIFIGVAFMFYLSSLGGFGGESTLSWWWAALIIPYPVGWLITLITLIVRWTKRTTTDAT